jgi:hypothetical protein
MGRILVNEYVSLINGDKQVMIVWDQEHKKNRHSGTGPILFKPVTSWCNFDDEDWRKAGMNEQ